MKLDRYFNSKNLNIPNFLSLTRILLIPVILYCFLYGNQFVINYVAIPLVFIAFATDFFDGYLARKWGQITDLGKILDPIADKIAILAIALFLFFRSDFPLWLILIIVIRDLLIIAGASFIIEKKDLVLPSNIFGKWTTGIIFVLFIVYLFNIDFLKFPLELLSALFILLSFSSYLRNFITIYSKK